jgi:hypothetical protein
MRRAKNTRHTNENTEKYYSECTALIRESRQIVGTTTATSCFILDLSPYARLGWPIPRALVRVPIASPRPSAAGTDAWPDTRGYRRAAITIASRGTNGIKGPYGNRKSSGKMADRCIHCDYQVSHHCSRVAKILQERGCIKERSWNIAQRFRLAGRPVLLKTDNCKSRKLRNSVN